MSRPGQTPPIAQLLLYPLAIPPQWARDTVAKTLHNIGFSGEPIEPSRRYLIGDHFLSQISFLGCSPAIEVSPGAVADNGDMTAFTHIYLSPLFDEPRFVYDPQLARPICVQCGTRFDDWQQRWQHGELSCPQCQHRAPAGQFRWRRHAATARFFVAVLNVYPREAIPTDGFLRQLSDRTATQWDYFYCHCPLLD